MASSMKHSAVPTTLATPPWIEGDFESETHKECQSSVSSLACMPVRLLPRMGSARRTDSSVSKAAAKS